MGELGEKTLRFVVCAVQERYTRAEVLFGRFFYSEVLFVAFKKKKHLKPRFL